MVISGKCLYLMKNEPDSSICILLPVINEADNLRYLLPEIHTLFPRALVLVVDDNSVDKTSEVIDQNVELGMTIKHLKRDHRFGIGSAHKLGIQFATENGFEVLCTMDADLTHDPREIKKLLAASRNSEITVGSRFAPGGVMENWKFSRRILAKIGNLMTNFLFKMQLDSSSSFRIYMLGNRDFLRILRVTPDGYDFFFTSTILLRFEGIKIKDVGVKMNQRLNGESKMTPSYVFKGVARIFLWKVLLKKKLQKINS